jgi:penicillin amidase
MRIPGHILSVVGTVCLLVLASVIGVLWLTLPPPRQDVQVPGLSAPVYITFDQNGVPRIHAGSEADAAAALGFVHGRDRMFQMELTRRIASGRLAELVGPPALEFDELMRTLGLRSAALADYSEASDALKKLAEAYSRGVNAWIDARGRFAAPEFLLIGRPEHWEPADCLLWAKLMGLWLSSNYRTELARLDLAGKLPLDRVYELWPAQKAGSRRPDASAASPRYAEAGRQTQMVLPSFPAAFTEPSTASNEWAVDGQRSATGAPLLAGDPHLAFRFPATWYLARIETPQGFLAGATSPGVPLLVLGHNSRIAWTFTTTGADVEDVFEEAPLDSKHYKGPDGPLPFGSRQEHIRVRGSNDVTITVRATRHGPVISDLPIFRGIAPKSSPVLAVEMANLAPHDTAAMGLYTLNRSATVEDAGRAAAAISSPVQNLLVADRQRIALYVTGRVPIRRSGDGSFPIPGSDGTHDWVGFASGDELPRYVAPASGRLVNANDPIAPPDYGVFLGRDWFGDWRAQRIRQMLDQFGRASVENFTAMQADVISTYAQQLLPVLRKVPASPGIVGEAVNLLRNWNGAMTMDRPEPLIFNAWLRRFYGILMAGAGVPVGSEAAPMMEFTAWVLSPEGRSWCGSNCDGLVASTLKGAVEAIAERHGNDPRLWRWGTEHQAVFADQALQGIPVLGALARRQIDSPGDDSTVDRGGTPLDSFTSVHGASFRAAYDLADLEKSRFIIAPGQSGNPFSRHAWDFLLRWRNGETIVIGRQATEVSGTVVLAP